MDQPTVLTIFVALCALAMLIQASMLIGIFVIAKQLQAKISVLLPQVQSLIPEIKAMLPEVKGIVSTTRQTVEDVKKQIAEIGTKTNAIVEVTKGQFVKIDELLTDAGNRAKVQLDRAELVLDDTMSRTQQTVSIVQSGVIAPIREVHGLLAGVRAAIGHLGRSRRPSVDHATADEEMFI